MPTGCEEKKREAAARARRYYARHKAEIAARTRSAKANDPAKFKARKRRWESENAEHFKAHRAAYDKKRYKERGDQRRAYQSARREMYTRDYLWQYAKTRAKRQGVPFDILPTDIVLPARCPVLGIPIKRNLGKRGPAAGSPTLDKIVPALGYVRGNIAVISFRANALKRDGTLPEIEALARWLRSHHRKRRAKKETPQLRLILGDVA